MNGRVKKDELGSEPRGPIYTFLALRYSEIIYAIQSFVLKRSFWIRVIETGPGPGP